MCNFLNKKPFFEHPVFELWKNRRELFFGLGMI